MRIVVVYESMFGNTRQVAEAIAAGIGRPDETAVMPVHEAAGEALADADLVVVGGPTHMHGLSRPSSRKMAGEIGRKPDSHVSLEPDFDGPGLREWLTGLHSLQVPAAAFDTRLHGPAMFTGRASKAIRRMLRRQGAEMVVAPESFIVGKDDRLAEGELDHARAWGWQLAQYVPARSATDVHV